MALIAEQFAMTKSHECISGHQVLSNPVIRAASSPLSPFYVLVLFLSSTPFLSLPISVSRSLFLSHSYSLLSISLEQYRTRQMENEMDML